MHPAGGEGREAVERKTLGMPGGNSGLRAPRFALSTQAEASLGELTEPWAVPQLGRPVFRGLPFHHNP